MMRDRFNYFFSRARFHCALLLALLMLPSICAAQSVDDGFDPDADGIVRKLAIQPDGKLIIGGDFTTLAGAPHSHLARLNVDGSIDASFATNDLNATVSAIIVQNDGKIVIGGDFDHVGATPRSRIARLNPDGTLDMAFNPDAGSSVFALALQPDGKILVGGDFVSIASGLRNRLARLNPDGSLDTTFTSDADRFVPHWRCSPMASW